jgi:hypothetical protein
MFLDMVALAGEQAGQQVPYRGIRIDDEAGGIDRRCDRRHGQPYRGVEIPLILSPLVR